MRVLILNGSPRPKGNTKQMIQAFCEGLETAGHEYGVYDVCKMNIHGCLACEYCHTKGNGQCVQKDDMQFVYHELQEAEMLVTTRNTVDAKAAIGEIIREYSTPGTEGYEGKLTETLLKAADRMRGGGYPQTNGLPQDILGTLLAADEVYCEVPFSYKDDSDKTTVWNGVMDVIYSGNGEWHIVDYKTNADGSDLDTRYQAQLSAYVKSLQGNHRP